MITNHICRIQFFTKKAAAYLENPTPHRLHWLQVYRDALARRLAVDGYRWRPAIQLD